MVNRLHIELSSRCQASCPMCPRNHSGGAVRNFVGPTDITLMQFQKWFTPNWLSQLKVFLACGNYGDPLMNKDVLAILTYLRSHNQNCHIDFHTNGSAHNIEWWQELAAIIGKYGRVTFGIDGFENNHLKYRNGTNWNHILRNASILIENGVTVCAATLVFEHNKHEITQLEQYLYSLGFEHVNIKHTTRFSGEIEFPVDNGLVLKPAGFIARKIMKDISAYEIWKSNIEIDPECLQNGGDIYVDVNGRIWQCCYIAESYTRLQDPDKSQANWAKWSARCGAEIKEIVESIPSIYLDNTDIEQALKIHKNSIAIWENAWNSAKKPCNCVVFCSKKS